MQAIHADRVSLPGRELAALLGALPDGDRDVKDGLALLRGWDGTMDRDSGAAAVYALFRERLVRDVLTPLLGPLAAARVLSAEKERRTLYALLLQTASPARVLGAKLLAATTALALQLVAPVGLLESLSRASQRSYDRASHAGGG